MKKMIFAFTALLFFLTASVGSAANPDFAALFQQAGPAVNRVMVAIQYEIRYREQKLNEIKNMIAWENGNGTGFFISRDGHVLTNYHVIAASKVEENSNPNPHSIVIISKKPIKREILILWRGKERGPDKKYNAELVGYDEKLDIAVLKAETTENNFPIAVLGDSDKIETGENISAIGSPNALDSTITSGIISQAKRNTEYPDAITEYIQHTAAINPGNSGGPLYDIKGKVIGVNTRIALKNDKRLEGTAFAIPINEIKEILPVLMSGKRVRRFRWQLWILPKPLHQIPFNFHREIYAEEFQMKIPDAEFGFLVVNPFPGGPAQEAGLEKGDIIVKIASPKPEKEIQTNLDLMKFIMNTAGPVEIEILRNGEKKTLRITPEIIE
ncbi:MAG: trypsin-like peptidase domain-containing protein [Patescibacteria group bacterium]